MDEIVLGNHDAVIGGRLEEDIFSDEARRVIDWTRTVLDDSAADLLSSLPAVVEGDHFMIAHGEVFDPERFGYIENEMEARENFDTERAGLIFVGHTHYPGIFALDVRTNSIRSITANDFIAHPDMRYIVNAGSVGDPRDGGVTACYCVFDDYSRQVSFRRVPFDIDGYREDLLDRGLDIRPQFLSAVRMEGWPSAPVEDSPIQVWAPPRQRTERPAQVLRVRHVEHGLTEEEQMVAAEAQLKRQHLAEALKAARLEEKQKAKIEAANEVSRRKREAAEAARQRKIELARAIEARMREKEKERAEAKIRTEALTAKKQAAAMEENEKKEEEEKRAAEQAHLRRPESAKKGEERMMQNASGTPGVALSSAKPVSRLETSPATGAADDAPVVETQAGTAAADIARKRKLALARAAQEKMRKRLEQRKAEAEIVRMAIRNKMEAACRAQEASGGGTPPTGSGESATDGKR